MNQSSSQSRGTGERTTDSAHRPRTSSVTSPSMNSLTQTRISKLLCYRTNLCAPIIKRDFQVTDWDQSNQTRSCGYGSVCRAAAYKRPWIIMKNPLTLALSTPTLIGLFNQIHPQSPNPPLCHQGMRATSNLHIRKSVHRLVRTDDMLSTSSELMQITDYFHEPSVHL